MVNTKRRLFQIILSVALMVAGLAASRAVPADASTTSVTVYWQLGPGPQGLQAPYGCTANTTHTYDELPVLEIVNNCGTRVWLHRYNSDGSIDSYCVNPGGGLAYDFSVGYTEIQVTANAYQCDADASGKLNQYAVGWYDGQYTIVFPKDYDCVMGAPHTLSPNWVYSVSAGNCNFRIWLHQYTGGNGKDRCISPGGSATIYPPGSDGSVPEWYQVEGTYNQAPCGVNPPF
jgi:hypothetical protein